MAAAISSEHENQSKSALTSPSTAWHTACSFGESTKQFRTQSGLKMNSAPFKRCTLCETEWASKDDFLNDPSIVLNGYQFTSKNYRSINAGGLLLFTHIHKDCGTTLALYVHSLKEKKDKISSI